MADPKFIAGDWGTSHLRLTLCDTKGQVHASAEGPGASDAVGRFAEILGELSRPWRERWGELDVVMAGMVGSSFGWIEAPYLKCPLAPTRLADACVAPHGTSGIRIVPGVSCQNAYGARDFMRGEETQILGALDMDSELGHGRRLLGLPGTHCKWVFLQDGEILEFLSAPTGEVFAALRDHTVLVRGEDRAKGPVNGPAFLEGLQQYNRYPDAGLLHRLFECRSRTLSGELMADGAASYLSGLLVASDVLGALRLFADRHASDTVHLIGRDALTDSYARALLLHGREYSKIDGARASVAGLTKVRAQLIDRGVLRAAH